MLRNVAVVVVIAGFSGCFTVSASAYDIRIDLGSPNTAPTLDGTWNTIPNAAPPPSLLGTDGVETGIGVNIQAPGSEGFGASWATDKQWVDRHAAADALVAFAPNNIVVTFFDVPAGKYDISMVASVSFFPFSLGDYQIFGQFADSIPNGDDYNASGNDIRMDVLTWNAVSPDVNNQIILTATPAPGNEVRINALQFVPEPGSLLLLIMALAAIGTVRPDR